MGTADSQGMGRGDLRFQPRRVNVAQQPLMVSIDMIEICGRHLPIYTFGGEKWVGVRDAARILGYASERGLGQFLDRNVEEFGPRTGRVRVPMPRGGMQEIRVLNYDGFLRACLMCDVSSLQQRDWAENELIDRIHARRAAKRDRWEAQLTPTQRLSLVRLRVRVLLALAADRGNQALINAYAATYGGWAEYREAMKEWAALGLEDITRPEKETEQKREGPCSNTGQN